jgi:hypothetical protein
LWETASGKERTLKTSRRAFSIGAISMNDDMTLHKVLNLDAYKDPTQWLIIKKGG